MSDRDAIAEIPADNCKCKHVYGGGQRGGKTSKIIAELQAENARLREALEKIASPGVSMYLSSGDMAIDMKKIAKQALEGK